MLRNSKAGANASASRIRTLGESLELLRTRRFGTFWFASLLSNTGTWAQGVAQPWLLLSIGASPFLVGLDAFCMDAPVWALTLAGGVLADRADRRVVITLFQSLQMLCPMLIVVLLLAGTVRPWIVIGLSLVVGITDALSMPSFQSIVPSIVDKERLGAGMALNSTQFNLSRIIGPALAGILMTAFGMVGCYIANAVSYVPFILSARWVLPNGAAPTDHEQGATAQTQASVRDIVDQPQLRGALLMVLASGVLSAPILTFSPVLIKQSLGGGAVQFGVALSAFGIGGVLGSAGLLSVDKRRDRRRIGSRFAILYGAAVVLAALSPCWWVLPAVLVLAGISMTVSNTCANTFLLGAADARLRGRTVSLYMLAMRGGTALGSLLTGLSVSVFGVREALVASGIAAVAVQVLIRRSWLGAGRTGSTARGNNGC